MSPYALYPLTSQRAVTHHTGLAGELSIAAYKAVEAIEAVWNWIDRRSRRAEAIRELSRLSDHMLKDIGVRRGEIHDVVEAMLDRQFPAPAARPVAPPPAQVVRPSPRPELPVADNDNNERRFSAMI